MIDVEKTIISQYGNSATITRLIANMNEHIDPRTNFDDFFDFVWNVETAQGFGLDIWGRIVGVGRQLTLVDTGDWFGFSEAAPDESPFGELPFNSGPPTGSDAYLIADDAYRSLILIKALANISATNAPSINILLQNLFASRGRCYVNDLGGMQMRYTFEFLLNPYEIAVMTQSGVLLRPSGVGATVINLEPTYFGFSEAGVESSSPFGEYPFVPEESVYAAS